MSRAEDKGKGKGCLDLGLLSVFFLPFSYCDVCFFVALVLVSSVLGQETSWEERLRNDLFCVEWDVKP